MSVPSKSSPQPQIDLDSLDYPSDSVTIKHLRRLFPREFRAYNDPDPDPDHRPRLHFLDPSDNGEEFMTMLHHERNLAVDAFHKALGRQDQDRKGWFATREELWEYLEELYTKFQIAQGPLHARQLLRDLENAAAEQALRQVPGRRL